LRKKKKTKKTKKNNISRLHTNQLSGQIPTQLGNLKNVVTL